MRWVISHVEGWTVHVDDRLLQGPDAELGGRALRLLANYVHIPDAVLFASARDHFRQPWAVLHELAHAYHDQVLGFEDRAIKAAWERFPDSRRYEAVLQIDGRMEKHYGLTDPFSDHVQSFWSQSSP